MVPASVIDVAGIDEDSITNGPGLRFVLFVQGCPHHCVGCHNPQTHPFGSGKKMDTQTIFRQIRANPLQSGVTFSGGEPFCQAPALTELGQMVKSAGYDLVIYSGFTFESLLRSQAPGVKELLALADVLIDGMFLLGKKDILLRFRGSGNQRILDVPASLTQGKAIALQSEEWN